MGLNWADQIYNLGIYPKSLLINILNIMKKEDIAKKFRRCRTITIVPNEKNIIAKLSQNRTKPMYNEFMGVNHAAYIDYSSCELLSYAINITINYLIDENGGVYLGQTDLEQAFDFANRLLMILNEYDGN